MMIIFTLFLLSLSMESSKPIAWCFGYGSLVHSYAEKAKFVEVNIFFRRVWNARNSKARATFLGLESTSEKNLVSGVIYPIFSQTELNELDIREQGYSKQKIDFTDVNVIHEGLNSKMINTVLDPTMNIFTYVPTTAGDIADAHYPILQSYIDLCAEGFLKFKTEATTELNDPLRRFLETTAGWSPYMLNDRVLCRRPWKYTKSSFVIDHYLESEAGSNHDIPVAYYPVEYSIRFFDELKVGLESLGHDRVAYVDGKPHPYKLRVSEEAKKERLIKKRQEIEQLKNPQVAKTDPHTETRVSIFNKNNTSLYIWAICGFLCFGFVLCFKERKSDKIELITDPSLLI